MFHKILLEISDVVFMGLFLHPPLLANIDLTWLVKCVQFWH